MAAYERLLQPGDKAQLLELLAGDFGTSSELQALPQRPATMHCACQANSCQSGVAGRHTAILVGRLNDLIDQLNNHVLFTCSFLHLLRRQRHRAGRGGMEQSGSTERQRCESLPPTCLLLPAHPVNPAPRGMRRCTTLLASWRCLDMLCLMVALSGCTCTMAFASRRSDTLHKRSARRHPDMLHSHEILVFCSWCVVHADEQRPEALGRATDRLRAACEPLYMSLLLPISQQPQGEPGTS
jgi:hypothetical protein